MSQKQPLSISSATTTLVDSPEYQIEYDNDVLPLYDKLNETIRGLYNSGHGFESLIGELMPYFGTKNKSIPTSRNKVNMEHLPPLSSNVHYSNVKRLVGCLLDRIEEYELDPVKFEKSFKKDVAKLKATPNGDKLLKWIGSRYIHACRRSGSFKRLKDFLDDSHQSRIYTSSLQVSDISEHIRKLQAQSGEPLEVEKWQARETKLRAKLGHSIVESVVRVRIDVILRVTLDCLGHDKAKIKVIKRIGGFLRG